MRTITGLDKVKPENLPHILDIAERFQDDIARLSEGNDARCETCAFRGLSEAHWHGPTLLKVMKSMIGLNGTFYCHEGKFEDRPHCDGGGVPVTPCRGFLYAHRLAMLEMAASEVTDDHHWL